MKKLFLLVAIFFSLSAVKAQTLVTIGSTEITVPEFLWVYNKGKDQASTPKELREYLDLYIRFRMKVLDAESQGLHKEQGFIEELNGYRARLAERYLLEREVSDDLVNEAYERSLKVINASHILIACPFDANPADTLTAYNKMRSIREQAVSGKPFTELAIQFSEEPGANQTGGNLGDFTVFQMTYPFETAAYQTGEGQVSGIVRTRFGYHVIKVSKIKPNPGQVEIGHILISSGENAADSNEAREKAVEIYKRLLNGGDFGMMAKQFSDDRSSADRGGILQILTSGKADKKLEEVAFALEKPGDISAPVETSYGWHIIKLIRKIGVPPFSELQSKLINRVAADERSILGYDIFLERLKKQSNFQENSEIKDKPGALLSKLSSPDENGNDPLFTFSNRTIVLHDFLKFAALNKRDLQSTESLYQQFVQKELTAFENEGLEKKYPEFRYLMDEYRNGILLFNLSEKKIWTHQPSDSLKLIEFYKSRSSQYTWKERAEARIFMLSSAAEIPLLKSLITLNKSNGEILQALNKANPINLVINEGLFERGKHSFLDRAKWADNSETEVKIGNSYALVKIKKIWPPAVKSFAEVQDVLLTDYEKHLEEEWFRDLERRFPVKINQSELKKISRASTSR